MRRIVLLAAVALIAASVLGTLRAQPTSSVNDCTFLRDPVDLRDCIDAVEGRRRGPPVNPLPDVTDVVPARQIAPRPLGGRRSGPRPGTLRGSGSIDQVVSSRRPAVTVDQVSRSKAAASVSIDQIPNRARQKAGPLR